MRGTATAAKKKQHKLRNQLLTGGIAVIALVIIFRRYFNDHIAQVLTPAGPIAAGERRLFAEAVMLMLIVVIPVFIILFSFAWHYRETNNKAKYRPHWDHSRLLEVIWWTIPSLLIIALAGMAWRGSYDYDPYKPLASTTKALHVQVVAEQGWWLFIYPDNQVASVDTLMLPENTPVDFSITADAPMNSFWIPQLGGQIYAMPGMVTELHLLADKLGTYHGSSANISGKRFANMTFKAVVTTPEQFGYWARGNSSGYHLSKAAYNDIYQQSEKLDKPDLLTYGKPASGLFEAIVNKYMTGMPVSTQPVRYDSDGQQIDSEAM